MAESRPFADKILLRVEHALHGGERFICMRSPPALPTHRPIGAAIIDYHQHRGELPGPHTTSPNYLRVWFET